MTDTVEFTVSGKTFVAAIEASQVPIDEDWPWPTERRRGRGYQHAYTVTPRVARLIVSHLEDVADILEGSGDPEAAVDRTAIRKDATRIRATLATLDTGHS